MSLFFEQMLERKSRRGEEEDIDTFQELASEDYMILARFIQGEKKI